MSLEEDITKTEQKLHSESLIFLIKDRWRYELAGKHLIFSIDLGFKFLGISVDRHAMNVNKHAVSIVFMKLVISSLIEMCCYS